jgi:RNA methyltransferase, TrmH family
MTRVSHDDGADIALDIASPTNLRVKRLVGLRKRRTRDDEGVTLVEGHDEIVLALDAGVRVRELYWCPALVRGRDIAARLAEAPQTTLSRAAFDRASYRESPDGWLAVVDQPGASLDTLEVGADSLILVCEAIEKPGNLGAMLRTADAAGVSAVVAADPLTDWGNPNVVRASKGTVFAVPIASAGSAEVARWLHDLGIRIVVASPETDGLVTDLDLTGATAIVVGAEHEGLTDVWLDAADDLAKLPMVGRVNSLNVATSAAIVVYEAVRQRARHA